MSGPDDEGEQLGISEPWHVSKLPDDAAADEVPAEVTAAAKRAIRARRPHVRVLDLVDERVSPEDDARYFRFSDGVSNVELRAQLEDPSVLLRIRCPEHADGRVEILHGGAAAEVTLDGQGAAEVEVRPGLLSLVLESGQSSRPSVQTMWVRIP